MHRIREFRVKKSISQQKLAEAIGVDRGLISLYETGRRNPKLSTLKKIASVLNCSYLSLIDSQETEEAVIAYAKSKWNIDIKSSNEVI